ncbi:MAG TPA: redox-regulated ATPase YchF [Candidatus Atribacteria bacterium]|nr:redox-regulated ATPase YchF [Candidatus Atribacteria bacterium]
MGLKAGIVGLPNSGKTTIFNLLARGKATVASYPFCTIDPNVGIVEVPDGRLEILASLLHPPRVVRATIEFIDVAGLVEGASKGEGLGNQFLSNIRGVDAAIEVIRFFQDEKIPHILGKVDPLQDKEIVDLELMLSDLEVIERRLEKLQDLTKKVKDERLKLEKEILEKGKHWLEEGRPLRFLELNEEEKEVLKPYQFITLKPLIYVANLDENENSKHLFDKVRKELEEKGEKIIPVFARLEEELEEIPVEEREVFIQEFGIEDTGLNLVVKEAYQLLGLITFYTFGDKELRAWELPRGSKAPQAAGRIHTDMEKGFIKAEVINYEELVAIGSWERAREEGRIRQEGRDYEIKDGDLVYFRFSPR